MESARKRVPSPRSNSPTANPEDEKRKRSPSPSAFMTEEEKEIALVCINLYIELQKIHNRPMSFVHAAKEEER